MSECWWLTAIPPGSCPISSDLGSQARSGPVSTWMGDRLGIPGAVSLLPWSSGGALVALVLAWSSGAPVTQARSVWRRINAFNHGLE